MLGTVEYRIGGAAIPATRTTPEAPDLQGYLRQMRDAGCGACAMEVSSHALALRRADAIQFAGAVFTNLTRDHLDFHGSMEDYFAAKRRLFELAGPGAPALVNLDDPRSARPARRRRPPDQLRRRSPGGRVARTARFLAQRPVVRRPLPAGHGSRAVAAGRQAERLQHPGGRRRDRGDGRADRGHRAGAAEPGRRPRPLRRGVGGRRRHHRGRGLRAHRRRAAQPAGDGAPDGAPAGHGVRRRRRSRPHQAAADGPGGGAAERRRGDHLRQPAQRGPGADHRRGDARRGAGDPADPGPRADRGRPRRGHPHGRPRGGGRRSRSSSPARATRSTRKSAA